jgi:hypothetical protein
MLDRPCAMTLTALPPPAGMWRVAPTAAAVPARSRWFWLVLLCPTLLGYALLGKGWAYLGVAPIFIGEVALLSGLGLLLVTGDWRRVVNVPAVWALVALGAWGVCRTWPFIPAHGVNALRDAAVWGYGAFALLVCGGILAQPSRLNLLLRRYLQFTRVFLWGIPVVWLVRRFLGDSLPCWPGSDVPILDAKGGDVFVHLGGTLAFWVAGFEGRVSLVRVSVMAFCVALIGTFDRAGLLAYLAVFGVCLVHRPADGSLWRMMVAGLCGLVLLAVTNIRIQMPGREREISSEQILNNVWSIVSHSEAGDLDGTKRWRLEWWGVIADYTVFGEYFWTGKGFGINLADDDGFQCNADGSVRSPHNVHMTFLARAGVPGVFLWGVVQGVWAAGILRGYVRSRLAADPRGSGLFLFLGAYWMAFLINASFDVFLEGPMGGIWFWTVYGAGLAAMRIHRLRPDLLDPAPALGGQLVSGRSPS